MRTRKATRIELDISVVNQKKFKNILEGDSHEWASSKTTILFPDRVIGSRMVTAERYLLV